MLSILFFSITVTACDNGGSEDTKPASTLSGVAAVSDPIANGTIQIICAEGDTLNTSTNSTGAWQVTISGQTPPCAVEVSGGTVNGAGNTTPYHSIATSTGTANINLFTDLMLANLLGTATPDNWFTGLDPSTLALVTPTLINGALSRQCTALSGLTSLCATNPITTVFTPTGVNTLYKLLVALQVAIGNSGVSYINLLGDASDTAYTAPVTGFNTALTDAFTAIDIPATVGFTGNFLGWTGSDDAAHSFVLVRVNGQTGAVTTIGGSGFYPALAYRPGGQLYGIGSTLQIINPTNGTTMKVGDFHYQAETYILMSGASFSPDGSLYVIENGGSPKRIFTVDLSNAALTYVGAPTALIRSLEFASNRTLYASFANLFTLNASDASTIATVGTLGAYVSSLTFGSGGSLFGIDVYPSTSFYTVGFITGLATSVTLLDSTGLRSLVAEQTATVVPTLSLSTSAQAPTLSSPPDLDALLAMERESKAAHASLMP